LEVQEERKASRRLVIGREGTMRRRIASVGAILLLLLCSVPTLLRAQGLNGQISGTVTDPSGAAIPNAELKLRDLSTGAVTKTESAQDGLYAFPNLLAGTYDLTVSASGFTDFEQSGIERFGIKFLSQR
jgi:hypothetical protein